MEVFLHGPTLEVRDTYQLLHTALILCIYLFLCA